MRAEHVEWQMASYCKTSFTQAERRNTHIHTHTHTNTQTHVSFARDMVGALEQMRGLCPEKSFVRDDWENDVGGGDLGSDTRILCLQGT